MEALNALRERVIAGHKPSAKLDGDSLIIGEGENAKRFPRKTKTPYKLKGNFLELDQIWLACDNADQKQLDYVTTGVKMKIKSLNAIEKNELLGWMKGTKETNLLDVGGLELLEASEDESRGVKRQRTEDGHIDTAMAVDGKRADRRELGRSAMKPPSQWTLQDILANEDSYVTAATMMRTKKGFADLPAQFEQWQKQKDAANEAKKGGGKKAVADLVSAPAAPSFVNPSAASALKPPSWPQPPAFGQAHSHAPLPAVNPLAVGSLALPFNPIPHQQPALAPGPFASAHASGRPPAPLPPALNPQTPTKPHHHKSHGHGSASHSGQKDKHKHAHGHSSSHKKPSSSSAHRHGHHAHAHAADKKAVNPDAAIPIIIVPDATSSLITMHNAKELLSLGNFVPSAECKAKNPLKETIVRFDREQKFDKSKNCTYQIIDDVSLLKTPADWERVVAVFASGKQWQFTDWPFKSPAAIFDTIAGFHLHFDDEAPVQNIKDWKVHKLSVSKNKRYQDRSLVTDFWQILTDFIAAHPVKKKKLIF